jgi:pimeloyl-ACP methyl ester carboxylesterase
MVFCRTIDYEFNITDESDGGRLLTRRRVLAGGGGVLGLLGGGAWYVQQGLQGDDGDYEAPDQYPILSTRGVFDGEGGVRSDVESDAPQREGDWSVVDADADALVVYVHGLNASEEAALNQAYTTRTALRNAGVRHPVVGYSWDSDREWAPAKRTAAANGPAFADWLTRWASEDGRPVHVIAHSLGARVTCECLQALAADDRTEAVASVSLLGGAIPRDSVETGGAYGDAIETATPQFANFYSGKDNVLGWLYRVSDGANAVGHGGIADPERAPSTYEEVDVSDRVSDHYSYYEPGAGCADDIAARLP